MTHSCDGNVQQPILLDIYCSTFTIGWIFMYPAASSLSFGDGSALLAVEEVHGGQQGWHGRASRGIHKPVCQHKFSLDCSPCS